MCVSRCPRSLIKMNVIQTTGKHSLVRKQAEGEKVKQQTRLLMPVHTMKLPSGLAKKSESWTCILLHGTFYNAQKWNTLLCILDCCNGLDQEPPQRCFLCVNVRLMREVKPKQAWLRHKEGACGVHDTPLLLPPRPVCPADVTERVGWWSTLIPSWESAEGESRPETQFFNPGRLLPPCSAR